jgi:hypothetical protein
MRSLTDPALLTALMLVLLPPARLGCTLTGDLGPSCCCWGAWRWLTAVELPPALFDGCGSLEEAGIWSRMIEASAIAGWLPSAPLQHQEIKIWLESLV